MRLVTGTPGTADGDGYLPVTLDDASELTAMTSTAARQVVLVVDRQAVAIGGGGGGAQWFSSNAEFWDDGGWKGITLNDVTVNIPDADIDTAIWDHAVESQSLYNSFTIEWACGQYNGDGDRVVTAMHWTGTYIS